MRTVEQLGEIVQELAKVVERDVPWIDQIRPSIRQLNALIVLRQGRLTPSLLDTLTRRVADTCQSWGSAVLGSVERRVMPGMGVKIQEMRTLALELTKLDSAAFAALFPETAAAFGAESSATTPETEKTPDSLYVVGVSGAIRERLNAYLKEELRLQTFSYEEETPSEEEQAEYLQAILQRASFAILSLTDETVREDGIWSRPGRLIYMIGLLQGRLGLGKVVLLKQEGQEAPAEAVGLRVIGFSAEQIEQSFYALQQALKQEGVIR
jgi:predicted nucleotide-binding protein